jgi:hypothetical protein
MAKTVKITISSVGVNSGPYNLFSDATAFSTAFESNISKAALVAGFTSYNVPDATTIIRVSSLAPCNNYVDSTVPPVTPTTTTTSTTVIPTTGRIYYNIGGGSGARLIIINSVTGIVALDETTVSSTSPSSNIFGYITVPFGVNYNVNVYWTSGSGNILSTRVCDLTASSQLNYLRGLGNVDYPLLLNYTLSSFMQDISVYVRTQSTDAPPCPIS